MDKRNRREVFGFLLRPSAREVYLDAGSAFLMTGNADFGILLKATKFLFSPTSLEVKPKANPISWVMNRTGIPNFTPKCLSTSDCFASSLTWQRGQTGTIQSE